MDVLDFVTGCMDAGVSEDAGKALVIAKLEQHGGK
jgi:hypothetical protein